MSPSLILSTWEYFQQVGSASLHILFFSFQSFTKTSGNYRWLTGPFQFHSAMCWRTWSLCFYCYKYLAGVKNKSGKWVVIFPSYPSFRGGKWDGSSVGHFCLEIREIKHPFSFPTVKSDDEALVLLPVKRSRAIKQVYLKKNLGSHVFFPTVLYLQLWLERMVYCFDVFLYRS